MRTICLLVYFLAPAFLFSQSFQQFVSGLDTLEPASRQAKTDSFLNASARLPYIESDTHCIFIFRGAANEVRIAGDQTGWEPSMVLTHVEGTDFWYKPASYENDARLDYKMVVDGSQWIPDPGNPFTCAGGFNTNSELRMPAFNYPPEIFFYSNIPHGKVRDTTCHSQILHNSRQVSIYIPANYDPLKEYPLVLFHDGPDYLRLADAANIFDYLIATQAIVPVIGIFVPAVERRDEYALGKRDDYASFLISELIPSVGKRYNISRIPGNRASIGASDGGNISLYLGLTYPDQFGKIAAQSSNVEPYLSKGYSSAAKPGGEIYVDIGTYDIGSLIPLVQNFEKILHAGNYKYQYREWHEGHSWGNWKGHLRYPLIQFFAPEQD